MRIDRRLMLTGVLLVVLSMTMATQYATTRVTYSFSIVHPSESDIRYIGSDNSSGDNQRVLRVNNNATTPYATIELGSWMPNSEKNYTATFGIVNEEVLPVNITYINVSGVNASYIDIWLHGDRDTDVSLDAGTPIKVVEGGAALYDADDVVWTLGAGDADPTNMNASGGGDILTPWDETSHVRYSVSDWDATNETSDFVWIQVSLDIESDASAGSPTGTIFIHFKASTNS